MSSVFKNIPFSIKYNKGGLSGLVTSNLGTAISNALLKEKRIGTMEGTRRRKRIRKQLLDDNKAKIRS
jgi:hypothetical protein